MSERRGRRSKWLWENVNADNAVYDWLANLAAWLVLFAAILYGMTLWCRHVGLLP